MNTVWALNFAAVHGSVGHMLPIFSALSAPTTFLLLVVSSSGVISPRLVILLCFPWMISAVCCMIMHTCRFLHPASWCAFPVICAPNWLMSGPPLFSLRPVNICRIAAMNLVAGEGPSLAQHERLRAVVASPVVAATPADPDDLKASSADDLLEMHKLSNYHMMDKEKVLPSFTHRRLMTLSNWPEWQVADDKQLNQHFDAGTFGMAVPHPPKDPTTSSQVFHLHCAWVVKSSGVRKSRACLDGSTSRTLVTLLIKWDSRTPLTNAIYILARLTVSKFSSADKLTTSPQVPRTSRRPNSSSRIFKNMLSRVCWYGSQTPRRRASTIQWH